MMENDDFDDSKMMLLISETIMVSFVIGEDFAGFGFDLIGFFRMLRRSRGFLVKFAWISLVSCGCGVDSVGFWWIWHRSHRFSTDFYVV